MSQVTSVIGSGGGALGNLILADRCRHRQNVIEAGNQITALNAWLRHCDLQSMCW